MLIALSMLVTVALIITSIALIAAYGVKSEETKELMLFEILPALIMVTVPILTFLLVQEIPVSLIQEQSDWLIALVVYIFYYAFALLFLVKSGVIGEKANAKSDWMQIVAFACVLYVTLFFFMNVVDVMKACVTLTGKVFLKWTGGQPKEAKKA